MRTPPPPPAPAPQPSARAMATAREFEAVFLAQSFDTAFKTLPASSFGGGEAAETWRHFLARAIADELAQSGRTGIAQALAPLMEGGRA